jgi:hypothetical protein
MAVVKNKTTERTREFWSHVESIAEQVRCNEAARFSRTRADGQILAERSDSVERHTHNLDRLEPRRRD